MYATIHSLFGMQYLRSSLTVPLYFERQITKDSNGFLKLPHYDSKIKARKWTVVASQMILLTIGLSLTVQIAFQWLNSIHMWEVYSIYKWSLKYDWLSVCKHLLISAACLNAISLCSIFAALLIVKKWIKETFDGERRWRCSVEGNFLLYFISLLLLTIEQAAITIWIS